MAGSDWLVATEPATEEEELAMREEYEEFLESRNSYSETIHLRAEHGDRLCINEYHPADDVTFRSVDTAVFPLGMRPICRSCVKVWRGSQ